MATTAAHPDLRTHCLGPWGRGRWGANHTLPADGMRPANHHRADFAGEPACAGGGGFDHFGNWTPGPEVGQVMSELYLSHIDEEGHAAVFENSEDARGVLVSRSDSAAEVATCLSTDAARQLPGTLATRPGGAR